MSEHQTPRALRREFLTVSAAGILGVSGALTACANQIGHEDKDTSSSDLAGGVSESGITERTIAEAEKLHGLTYSPEERRQIVQTIDAQIANVEAIRKIPKEKALMPALAFDPRLPGKAYSPQPDSVRLASPPPGSLPGDEAGIAYASVSEQGHWFRTGQITSRRLTEIYLDRIKRIAPQLECFITVTPELALHQADSADRDFLQGRNHGPLQGIPYGIKDVFDTAGVPSTWGAMPYKDRVPKKDALVATLLRNAGAVLLGKLATGSLANGSRWYGGDSRNPWNMGESAGGSSTGAGSATAAGLVGFSIGTDSLGSILNPSDRCGVTGLRPTFGRVPTRNSMPLTPSLSRIGPIVRTVEDAALVLAAINYHDPQASDSIAMGFSYDGHMDIAGLKVGYSPKWFETVGNGPAAQVPVSVAHTNVLTVLNDMGADLIEVDLPDLPYAAMIPMLYAEAAAVFEELTLTGRDEELVAQKITEPSWPSSWREVRLLSAVDYIQADRFRRQVMMVMDEIFESVEVLCGPLYGYSIALVAATNFTGHPGLTMRVGFDDSPTRTIYGAPMDIDGVKHLITENITFHGRLFEEGKMLALGRALEERLNVWRERPPVG